MVWFPLVPRMLVPSCVGHTLWTGGLGLSLSVGVKRFRCTEVLFQSSFQTAEFTSLSSQTETSSLLVLNASVVWVSVRIRQDLYYHSPLVLVLVCWSPEAFSLLVPNAFVTQKYCSSQVTVQHEVCRLHPQRAVHHVVLSPSTTVFQLIIERTGKKQTALSVVRSCLTQYLLHDYGRLDHAWSTGVGLHISQFFSGIGAGRMPAASSINWHGLLEEDHVANFVCFRTTTRTRLCFEIPSKSWTHSFARETSAHRIGGGPRGSKDSGQNRASHSFLCSRVTSRTRCWCSLIC